MRPILLVFATALILGCAGQRAARKPGPELAGAPAPARGSEKKAGEVATEQDLDGDGKPDLWVYSRKGPDGKDVVTRKERDLNGDGKIDLWEYMDAEGNVAKQVYDMDFDGKPDVILHFEKGQLVRKEYAFGFDGKPHTWSYYEKNKLARRERDTNGDGKVDYWEYWENGEIDRIGVDTDGDGQVDRWESRKPAAAEAGTPAAATPAPAK